MLISQGKNIHNDQESNVTEIPEQLNSMESSFQNKDAIPIQHLDSIAFPEKSRWDVDTE